MGCAQEMQMGIVGGRTGKGEVSWEGYMARGTALLRRESWWWRSKGAGCGGGDV